MKKLLTGFCLLIFAMSASSQGIGPVLTVEGGKIQGTGTLAAGVLVYKGIPYAAPPVGNLRWKEPKPVVPWQGIRLMDRFGLQSVQPDRVPGQFYQKEFYWMGDAARSEDCLFLNVWTPAAGETGKKLPVAMWIHGGAYMTGSGGEIQFDGEAWASRGVILVTINYRLGIFGFLAHPFLSEESPDHVSGNYGILDQLAALKWVRNNISQFGGDPDNITIFGQSAGAGSVQTLVASPLTRGLITKAIIQSGGGIRGLGDAGLNTMNKAAAEKSGREMMDNLGLTTLSMMRSATYQQLSSQGRTGARMAPHIDGYLSTATFTDAVNSGEVADIPYIIGYTANDIGNMREGIGEFCKIRSAKSSKPVFAYLFARPLPGDDAGAFHSSELWFMFHTLGRSWRPFTEADFALSNEMVDCWTNFVKYGNPNGKDGSGWKNYTAETPFFKVFDVK